MAKFCLLAERILPNYFLRKMMVPKERVVCVHGMCKRKKTQSKLRKLFTFWKKEEPEKQLCKGTKLENNLKIVQKHLEKDMNRKMQDATEHDICRISP